MALVKQSTSPGSISSDFLRRVDILSFSIVFSESMTMIMKMSPKETPAPNIGAIALTQLLFDAIHRSKVVNAKIHAMPMHSEAYPLYRPNTKAKRFIDGFFSWPPVVIRNGVAT